MPELEDECIFTTKEDQVKFTTQTNGDRLALKGLELTQGQATSLAWLVNADTEHELEWSVKVKEP